MCVIGVLESGECKSGRGGQAVVARVKCFLGGVAAASITDY